MKGVVLSGANNFFSVECEDGKTRFCSIKGKKIKHNKNYHNPFAPGDKVSVEADSLDEAKGQIIALQPRKNHFVRLNQKVHTVQILASNIDVLLCVSCDKEPPFRPRFIDRILLQAEAEAIPVIIIVNKIDLGLSDAVKARLENWQSLGYETRLVSAQNGSGIAELAARLSGLQAAIVGQSGVGKSSLLNALDPSYKLKTAAVSLKYNRGIHTTTQGLLLHIQHNAGNFDLIDTPGIRHFSPAGISADEVLLYFREMAELAGTCAFGLSCSHTHEKGCAVLAAFDNGDIHPDRFESWQNIVAELQAQKSEY